MGTLVLVHVLLDSDRFNAVNALDAWGASALYVAAGHGHKDVVKALLRSLRFTLAPQQDWVSSFTALHGAAWKGHGEVAKVLLSDSRFPTATVNAPNRWGGTGLHTAARFGHYNVVEALLVSPSMAWILRIAWGIVLSTLRHMLVTQMLLESLSRVPVSLPWPWQTQAV